ELLAVGGFHLGGMAEPVVTGSGEPVVTGCAQLSVLATAHQIDGLGKVFGNVELVENDLAPRLRQVIECGVDIRIPHVHGNGFHCTNLFFREAAPETIHALLRAALFDEQDTAAIEVIDQREITMATRERLLVHTQASDRLGLTPLQTTFTARS